VRLALPLVLLAVAVAVAEPLPSDGRTSYSRNPEISIPFDLRSNDRATKITLFYNFDGGPWKEYDSAGPGGKQRFVFRFEREGPYGFATVTEFRDGTTDTTREHLVEQKRVVYDRTPPRIVSVRPVTDANGNAGIEWDVTDDNLDRRGIRLEFRWDGQGRFEPIDRNVPFNARDSRFWKLKPRERMEVKVIATDLAGNKAESQGVMVGSGTGGDDPTPTRTTGNGSGPVRDSAVSPVAGTQPSLHYLKTKTVKLSVNATVGPSGLEGATLWWADDKLNWQKCKDEKGKMLAPEVIGPDAVRKLPVDFVFEAPTDELYNFVIVVKNHRNSSRRDPKPGETGDFQVMVDTIPPEVNIISTLVSKNGERGALVDIRWKASDKNIAPLPIKLEYAAVKAGAVVEAGAWKAIAPDWIDNTGQYTWTVPTGESHLFKIRVTCKDRAGNEKAVETPAPVNTDLSVPSVDAPDVKPGVTDVKIGPG
jgi:hypothetical protein